MFVPFDTLPGHARIWIYQSSRELTQGEVTIASVNLEKLCEQWQAHGVPLHASFSVERNRFIILAVDEQQAGASGCSIDSSVHFLKELQQALSIDLFSRSQVAFFINGKVETYHAQALKTLFEKHTLTGDTHAFNNLVATKKEWESGWLTPVKKCWLSRYLPKETVSR